MNIICGVTVRTSNDPGAPLRSISSCRAVYYSATDHTVVWQRQGNLDVPLLDHPGPPLPLLDADGHRVGPNAFAAPENAPEGSLVVSYAQGGCACGHLYKNYTPKDPAKPTGQHADREHAR